MRCALIFFVNKFIHPAKKFFCLKYNKIALSRPKYVFKGLVLPRRITQYEVRIYRNPDAGNSQISKIKKIFVHTRYRSFTIF